MTPVFKLLLFALAAGVLYPLIKSYEPQLAPVLAVAVSLGVVLMLLDAGTEVVSWLMQLGEGLDGEAFACLAKAAVISICTEWCCNLCKDNGLSAVSGSIGLVGRVLMLASAFPLFQTAYTTILGLAG